jgi:hypothetical protein
VKSTGHWRQGALLLIAAGASLVAGCIFVTDAVGFGQPAILVVAAVAGVLGFLTRRVWRGAVLGLVAGLAGGLGMVLPLAHFPEAIKAVLSDPYVLEEILVDLGVEVGLTGVPSVIAGSAMGLLGDVASMSARRKDANSVP